MAHYLRQGVYNRTGSDILVEITTLSLLQCRYSITVTDLTVHASLNFGPFDNLNNGPHVSQLIPVPSSTNNSIQILIPIAIADQVGTGGEYSYIVQVTQDGLPLVEPVNVDSVQITGNLDVDVVAVYLN